MIFVIKNSFSDSSIIKTAAEGQLTLSNNPHKPFQYFWQHKYIAVFFFFLSSVYFMNSCFIWSSYFAIPSPSDSLCSVEQAPLTLYVLLPNFALSPGRKGWLVCAGFTSRAHRSKTVVFLFQAATGFQNRPVCSERTCFINEWIIDKALWHQDYFLAFFRA